MLLLTLEVFLFLFHYINDVIQKYTRLFTSNGVSISNGTIAFIPGLLMNDEWVVVVCLKITLVKFSLENTIILFGQR